MKDKLRLVSLVLTFLLLLSIFIASLFSSQDPDLGWHLKYGEYFFQNNSILRGNTLSSLMPDFKWNNSSWATDLLTYLTFNNFGFLGLSVLAALVITATFFFIGKAAKLSLFERSIIFPILFYFVLPVNRVSFRGQLLSLLLIAIMFYVLSRFEQKNKRGLLLLIPLFAIWSNFHGEFILGLALFLIWVFVYSAKEIYLNFRNNISSFFKKEKFLFVSLLGSIIAVIINPFGIGVYKESLGHFDNPLQQSIAEFLPLSNLSTDFWNLLIIGIVLTLGFVMLGTGRKNLDKAPFYFPSLVLFLFTFWIKRYAWPLYYSCAFLMQPVVKFFEPDNKRHSLIMSGVFTISFFLFAVYVKYPFKEATQTNWSAYCESSIGCSQAAAKAVLSNKLNNEKLLTIYDYGGWLIWNYPEIKPTIDGRMHLWRNSSGYSAFEYYYQIEQNQNDIDNTRYNAVLTSQRKPIYERLLELEKEGKWEEIYADENSSVFVRNKLSKM